jgi:hypothetical protein
MAVGTSSQDVLVQKLDEMSQTQAQMSQTQAQMSQTLAQALAQIQAESRSISFSKVGAGDAQNLLEGLGISFEDGDPLPSEGLVNCGCFDMSLYADEVEATAPFLKFVDDSLKKQQKDRKDSPLIGRGGFKLLDLHANKELFKLSIDNQTYKGGLDGAIVPFKCHVLSAAAQMRAGLEIKQSGQQKAKYRERRNLPPMPNDDNAQEIKFTASKRGQTLMETLAAAIYAQFPEVMMWLSSFDFNTLIGWSLKTSTVTIWEDITFDQAVHKLAAHLRGCQPEEHKYRLRIELMPPGEQAALKAAADPILQLRKKMKTDNALLQQLDSLTAEMDMEEKALTALEMIQAYRPATSDWRSMFS